MFFHVNIYARFSIAILCFVTFNECAQSGKKIGSMDTYGWIAYNKRPEWSDVTPIYQTEKERSVVNIAYSEKFALIFAYFRAILQSGEKSHRVLELTKDAALLNPANYTVWKYRQDLLTALNADISEEFSFCRNIIEENPKNYQVWHHLRLLVEKSGDYKAELEFSDSVLKDDSKNYHAWQHRQWVVKKFQLFDDELDYSQELLDDDIHNNSAWNYRYFVVQSTTGFTSEIVDREIKFTLERVQNAPHNESAWNYLTGIADYAEKSQKDEIWDACQKLYVEQNCRASHLLSFMVFCLKEVSKKSTDSLAVKQQALSLIEKLEEIDPVRKNYWQYLKSDF